MHGAEITIRWHGSKSFDYTLFIRIVKSYVATLNLRLYREQLTTFLVEWLLLILKNSLFKDKETWLGYLEIFILWIYIFHIETYLCIAVRILPWC